MYVLVRLQWFYCNFSCHCVITMMERNLKSQLLCFNPAILKDSGFNEIDRAECQFFTTATILDNGSQVWGQLHTWQLVDFLLMQTRSL
jgi:hypothetical protein